MPYAVIQTDARKPPVEALARAFKVLRELVDMDAQTLAKDAYGIVAGGLPAEQARNLSNALAAESIATEVISEDDLLRLPAAMKTRQIDCLPERLVVYDTLDRPVEIGWEHVALVAAGLVVLSRFKRVEKTRYEYRGGARGGVRVPVTDVKHKEERPARPLLELYVDIAPGRYRLFGDECRYGYLGARATSVHLDNFPLLVQDLAHYATRAVLTRGTESLRSDETLTLKYPSRHAFEEEIIWSLWWMTNGRSNER